MSKFKCRCEIFRHDFIKNKHMLLITYNYYIYIFRDEQQLCDLLKSKYMVWQWFRHLKCKVNITHIKTVHALSQNTDMTSSLDKLWHYSYNYIELLLIYDIINCAHYYLYTVYLPVQCSQLIWHFPPVKHLLDMTSLTTILSSPVSVVLSWFPIINSLGISLRVLISVSSLKIIPSPLSTINSISFGFLIFAESRSRKSPIVLTPYKDKQMWFQNTWIKWST